MVNFKVAIDGPAGSGKSSISGLVAKKLNFIHIDTGAMYRAVTLEAISRGINFDDSTQYGFIDEISVIYKDNIIYLNGVDVSKEIRSTEVTLNVSAVSKQAVVRDKMVHFQRESAKYGKVLMDGRDIGTVVLPDAEVKIYLTASSYERAKRRLKELNRSDLTIEEVQADLERRDYIDSHREISPLRPAEDAIHIDTTHLTIDQVCEKIINIVCERLNKMENIQMKDVVLTNIRVKDKIKGTVCGIKKDQISIDVQNFTEGTMYLDHYTTDKNVSSFEGLVNIGDEIECEVTKVDEEHGIILLSRLNILKDLNFKELSGNLNKDITVKVTKKVNKGYNVNANGFVFFMPESQCSDNVKVGDSLKVRVLEINNARKTGVVSRRVVENEEYQAKKNQELEFINVGDVVTGEIVKIESFGAFIKFVYNQGLLRLNQVAHTYVDDLNKVLKVGSKIEVKVISKENGKILLSRKELLQTPYELYAAEHKVSDKVVGKVVNKMPFGLLLEVAENVRGLLHNSEYSWNPNDNFNDYCKIGDEVEVAIIAMNAKNERISFSRKALIDNPWSRVTAKAGELVEVEVTAVDAKGLTVAALGVDGFISAKDALANGQTGKLDDNYAVGDKVNAIITTVDPKQWILELSVRKHLANLERAEFEKYMETEADQEVNTNLGDLFKDLLK